MIGRLVARLRDERGITLSEMLVVMVFLGIIGASFATLFGSVMRHESDLRNQSLTQDEMRAAVDRITRDVRTAYSATGWPIESIAGGQMTFTISDRSSSPVVQRVSYRVSSGKLQRAIGPAASGTPTNWRTIVSGVTSTSPFAFADVNDATTAVAAQVRTVNLTLTFAGHGKTYTYTSSASPRLSP